MEQNDLNFESLNFTNIVSPSYNIPNNLDVTDPFVDVVLGNAKLAKTSVILNDLNPVWNESFCIELCHWAVNLNFEVRDKDHAYAEYIGAVQLPASNLVSAGISGNYVRAFVVPRCGQSKAHIKQSCRRI